MLEQLRRAVPDATAVSGSAEAILLPDASADVVVCAQAFHWFDHAAPLPEIVRVLRLRGRIALVWNMRQESELWATSLRGMIGSETIESGDAEDGLDLSYTTECFRAVSLVGRL